MEAGQELEQLRQVLRGHALDVLAGQDGDGSRRLRDRLGPALGRDDHLFMDLPGRRGSRRRTGRRLLSLQGRRREDRQQGGERDGLQAMTSARARRAPAAGFLRVLRATGRPVRSAGASEKVARSGTPRQPMPRSGCAGGLNSARQRPREDGSTWRLRRRRTCGRRGAAGRRPETRLRFSSARAMSRATTALARRRARGARRLAHDPAGRVRGAPGAERLGEDDALESPRPARPARRRADRGRGAGRRVAFGERAVGPAAGPVRVRLPDVQPDPGALGRGERRLSDGARGRRAARSAARRARELLDAVGLASKPASGRTCSRAASGSGSRSRARSPTVPRSSSPTSRRRTSTRTRPRRSST